MTTPKTLDRYGDDFLDLAEAINQLRPTGPREFSLMMDTRGKAVNFRQKFYAWRKLLAQEAPSMCTPQVLSCTVTVLESQVIFSLGERSLSSMKEQLRQQGFHLETAARGGVQPQPQPQPQLEIPHLNEVETVQQKFEDQLRMLGFKTLLEKGPSDE